VAGKGSKQEHAFHTNSEKNPWITVDLGRIQTVNAVVIENRKKEHRRKGLILSVSEDGQSWTKVWQAEEFQTEWSVPLTHFHAGIDVPGRKTRYLKLETHSKKPRPLVLQRVTVYGE
jgi:hypothetical protein